MALTWWDGVTVQVEMAFGEPPTAPTAWTDITADVRDIPFGQVGRRSEFVPFAPASTQLVLDNASRQYDPDYATGPYFGDLVPMVPCRITATVNVTDVDVFYGYVKGWPQQWSRFDATSTITLIDGTRFDKNIPLPGSAFAAQVIAADPVHYFPLQTDHRDIVTGASMSPYFGVLGSFTTSTLPISEPAAITSQVDPSNSDDIYSQPGARIESIGPITALEFWFDSSSFTGDPDDGHEAIEVVARGGANYLLGVTIWPFGDAPSQLFDGHTRVSYEHDADNVEDNLDDFQVEYVDGPNHVAVRADSSSLQFIVNGRVVVDHTLVTRTGSTSGDYLAIGVDYQLSLSHIAIYDVAPTAAEFVKHYDAGRNGLAHPYAETTGERLNRALDDAGHPVALRNIDNGTQTCGAYRPDGKPASEVARELEATEQGMLFTANDGRLTFLDRQTLWTSDTGVVFTDDEAANDVRLAGLVPDGNTVDTIRNIVTVSFDQVGAITRRDETSITDYGPASESVTSSPMPNGEAASNMAAYILRAKKDPTTRYTSMTATVRGQDGNTTRILDLLQRRIGDVVTIERLPVDTTPQVVKKAMIQGYRFRISRQDWVIDFYLSPITNAATVVPYLTLGDADDGKIGVTDGNLIPA